MKTHVPTYSESTRSYSCDFATDNPDIVICLRVAYHKPDPYAGRAPDAPYYKVTVTRTRIEQSGTPGIVFRCSTTGDGLGYYIANAGTRYNRAQLQSVANGLVNAIECSSVSGFADKDSWSPVASQFKQLLDTFSLQFA